MSEKKQKFSGLPSTVDPIELDRPPGRKRVTTLVIGLCLGALGAGGFVLRSILPTSPAPESYVQVASELCPQAKSTTPVKHSAIWNTLVERSASEEFKERAVEWLGGAVRIRYVLDSSLMLEWTQTVRVEPSRTTTWNRWA